jgi:NADPH-dependent 2,4-dienoyl-CoA reductase/sulfur reductase-like enzyme
MRVAELHRHHGVDLRCGVQVSEISHGAGAMHVELHDGEVVEADLIVIGIGVNPCVRWLEGSGVHIDDGVVCDEFGRSTRPHVWAAGDCARWPNVTTGQHHRVEQWQAALDQAQVVAGNLIHSAQGEALDSWTSVPYFWSDQYDVKIQFAGYPGGEPQAVGEAIGFREGDRATGLLTFNNPRLLARGRKVLLSGGTWSELAALGS